ncbi:MAG TPA: TlyA family RNA methyltransferase [Caldisericia bacterium]|nr:TlyA family RNA methyltransferase [Caldisericia bacterium]HOL83279.1 TlyA family RNA methyltransferase [Caldisericia bacterium]HON84319.1 TlyA family RNA methyltransferase [Caldisericia bacterium]HPC57079.1 TlyA family RNA methyltransferase [Caldisericia bacterium]HPP43865.1 TlyA family RNA methyltransferase [Caldisericia bacterium]
MERKLRLDKILFLRGIFNSRTKAQDAIKKGAIMVSGKKVTKGGIYLKPDVEIKLIESNDFVSRGVEKLNKVIETFNIDINNKICLDIGAGTGGFTQILLLYGAKRVYAVDVGENVFDKNLKEDKRVILKEKLNARYLTKDDLPEIVDIITQDTSFISSKKIISVSKNFLKDNGDYILLIKPQFELEKNVTKNGIVYDYDLHIKILKEMIDFTKDEGFHLIGLISSPMQGKKGNIEYFLYMKKINNLIEFSSEELAYKVVSEAIKELL